jgi:hypothetical protein
MYNDTRETLVLFIYGVQDLRFAFNHELIYAITFLDQLETTKNKFLTLR